MKCFLQDRLRLMELSNPRPQLTRGRISPRMWSRASSKSTQLVFSLGVFSLGVKSNGQQGSPAIRFVHKSNWTLFSNIRCSTFQIHFHLKLERTVLGLALLGILFSVHPSRYSQQVKTDHTAKTPSRGSTGTSTPYISRTSTHSLTLPHITSNLKSVRWNDR